MVDRFNDEPSYTPVQEQRYTPPMHCGCGQFTHIALVKVSTPGKNVVLAPASGVMDYGKKGWEMKPGLSFSGFKTFCLECWNARTAKVYYTADGGTGFEDEKKERENKKPEKANFDIKI